MAANLTKQLSPPERDRLLQVFLAQARGKAVARGDLAKIAATRRSITGAYLRGDEEIEVPRKRRPVTTRNTKRGLEGTKT